MKTANAYRKIPVHIELESLLKRRLEFVKAACSGTDDYLEWPVCCFGNDLKTPCRDYQLAALADEVLEKLCLTAEDLAAYMADMLWDSTFDEEKDSTTHLSLYVLRRNFWTWMQSLTQLTEMEKKCVMGHRMIMNEKNLRPEYNNQEVLWKICKKMDKCTVSLRMHNPLITHKVTKGDAGSYENCGVLSIEVPPELQGNLFFDYISNYYALMRRLRQDFPQVTFQCCSAGGGRLDCGAAAFHEEFWLSDNTDACDRLRMQWAASYFFPANAIGCHVTAVPNCYTGRETSLKFRFDVALAGRLGLELDPRKLTDAEMQEIRTRVELAAELRPITQLGELHRLVSPYEGPDCALLYTHEDRALLLAYTTQRVYTDQHTRIPLRGLNPATRYTIIELAPDSTGYHCPVQGHTLGGDTLLATGLPIRWTRPQQSCLILLQATDTP